MKSVVFLICFFVSFSSFAKNTQDNLIGTWQLSKFYLVNAKGKHDPVQRAVRCEKPSGLLIYTAEGTMSAGINCRSGGMPDGSPLKVFYTGTYQIKGSGHIVHYPKNSFDIRKIGEPIDRYFRFEGKNLVITGQGYAGIFEIVWKRF